MNHITLIGRATRDATINYTQDGTPVAGFALAVDRRFGKKPDGSKIADFFNIVAWRKLGELAGQYVKKGLRYAIAGEVNIRQYEDSSGNLRTSVDVIADEIKFLDYAKDKPAEDSMGTEVHPDDDSIPF